MRGGLAIVANLVEGKNFAYSSFSLLQSISHGPIHSDWLVILNFMNVEELIDGVIANFLKSLFGISFLKCTYIHFDIIEVLFDLSRVDF